MSDAETENNTARGIKNAEVRYKEHVGDLTVASHVYEKTSARKNKKPRFRINDDGQRVYVGGNTTERLKEVHAVEAGLRSMLEQANLEYEEGDASLLIQNKPTVSPFPFGMVFLAIVKDVLDALQITVVFLILVWIITLPVMLVLWFYFYNKMSGAGFKKKLLSWFLKRFGVTVLIEAIPFVGMVVPATTILVLMTHYKEVSFVKALNSVLNSIHKDPSLLKTFR